MGKRFTVLALAFLAVTAGLWPSRADAACGFFTVKNAVIRQPAQKVFLGWDPVKRVQWLTIQPTAQGNAADFGMVVPTPTLPKLHEMPRDLFKLLAVYSTLKHRESARSALLPAANPPATVKLAGGGDLDSLAFKIISPDRTDDLYAWLKANKYHYAGDEEILKSYVRKKWYFTVMKFDTNNVKKDKDGNFTEELIPIRFVFSSDQPVYPLRVAHISARDKVDVLLHVQAPHKVDLPGDLSYQYQWVPMLQAAQGQTPGGLPGKGADWLRAIEQQIPPLLQRGQELGFTFVSGKRPLPNRQGRVSTTLEWARKLTEDDIKVLRGQVPYSEPMPNIDEGFTNDDLKDPKRAREVLKVIQERLRKAQQERPLGYLVRHAPAEDIRQLLLLTTHLQAGQFVTSLRKTFTRDEINDDLVLGPARLGMREDDSEYVERLPTSPP